MKKEKYVKFVMKNLVMKSKAVDAMYVMIAILIGFRVNYNNYNLNKTIKYHVHIAKNYLI